MKFIYNHFLHLQGGVRRGLLFFALLVTTTLWAHNFEVDGIFYDIIDENNVEVTYKGSDYDSYRNEYSGEVIIPSTVTYNGTTYSVTSIGALAFYSCSSLTSVTIPNSVTSIERSAFYYCSSLTSVTIPNSVTSIGDWAFGDCTSLTSITIPNSVTTIGYAAFYNCPSLTSITIPNRVTSIGKRAFQGCSSLTSVTIGNSVTSIGAWAFCGCSFLNSITCLGTTPPEASDLRANTSTCTLTVPQSAYNAYLRHAYWGQFLNIVPSLEMESSAPEVYINPANPAQKLLLNGQVYILQDSKTYTVMGAKVK